MRAFHPHCPFPPNASLSNNQAMVSTPANAQQRLETQHNIWLVSVRPDGRPHMAPLWFVWHADKLYVCTAPDSVKSRNIRRNPHVALALEDGASPVICEGTAASLSPPWPAQVVALFKHKFDWDISPDDETYNDLLEVSPTKWLMWQT
jgi:PPOX class probable F420-dependent enzyme